MTVTRARQFGSERDVVLGLLREQRQLVSWKLAHVDDDAARSVTTASGLHLHGLVSHLTNVERWWLRDVMAGEDGLAYDWSDEDEDGEFHVTGVSMVQLLEDYAAECARCDVVIGAHSLEDTAARKAMSLRWIVGHLIEETARHLGHIDLLREQVDGAAGYLPVEAQR